MIVLRTLKLRTVPSVKSGNTYLFHYDKHDVVLTFLNYGSSAVDPPFCNNMTCKRTSQSERLIKFPQLNYVFPTRLLFPRLLRRSLKILCRSLDLIRHVVPST